MEVSGRICRLDWVWKPLKVKQDEERGIVQSFMSAIIPASL